MNHHSWKNDPKEKSIFLNIKEAIIGKKKLEFTYFDSTGNKFRRIVLPFKLIYKSRNWYLIAFCEYKKDYRFFKLSRINDITILDETFNMIYDYKIVENNNYNLSNLKLTFDKSIRWRIFEEFKETEITEDINSYIINTTMPKDEWLYNYLLSFGEKLIKIEPEEVFDVIKTKIKMMNKIYHSV